MILATTTVEDVDRFLKVFGTTGADKRALHGSEGSATRWAVAHRVVDGVLDG